MNKFFSILTAAVIGAISLVSCEAQTDVEAGGTAMQSMAGNWEVQVDLADANGNVLEEDCYNLGILPLYTYNTSDNSSTKMWIDDRDAFWKFKFKCDVDLSKKTFCTANPVPYKSTITATANILFGKVLDGAATNLHGMPNDSIAFLISFDDDDPDIYYLIHGQRFTGFKE